MKALKTGIQDLQIDHDSGEPRLSVHSHQQSHHSHISHQTPQSHHSQVMIDTTVLMQPADQQMQAEAHSHGTNVIGNQDEVEAEGQADDATAAAA